MSNVISRGRNLWTLLAMLAVAIGAVNFTATAEEEEPLHHQMEAINDAYKMLRRQARRKNFDQETIKLANQMAVAAVQAMMETPHSAEKVPTDKRPAFLADYQRGLRKLAVTGMDIQIAVTEGDMDKAADLIGTLGKQKSEGHEKFEE